MAQTPRARLTDRERVDAITRCAAEALSPHLLSDKRLTAIVPTSDERGLTLAQIAASGEVWLEPLKCSWALYNGADRLSLDQKRIKAVQDAAEILRKTRNRHNHQKLTDIQEAQAVREAKNAAKILLGLYGLVEAQRQVDDHALPPSITYVRELRDFLSALAGRRGEFADYEEARATLGLSADDVGSRILARQLNVLAAQQLILGEPQLCALIVDAQTGIPGPGFYWIVELDREAPEPAKRDAHKRALQDVWAFNWSN